MRSIQAVCLLLLCPALSVNTRQKGEDLEKQLKEVFSERTTLLQQLSRTSKELDSIKGNLQSLKNEESVSKKDVQRILELSHKQREEMKALQAALHKQLDEASHREHSQQDTIKFLKVEMEKKTKIIKDLQQENKSLKNKLLSGNKLCDAYAEESKKIQAQLKELRYGKKDLIFKGQQLMDLEQKLTAAKEELEKTALDKESELKALKDTVHICFSAVLHSSSSSSRYTQNTYTYPPLINSSRITYQQPHHKDMSKVQKMVTASKAASNSVRREGGAKHCTMEQVGSECSQNQTEESAVERNKHTPTHTDTEQQRSPQPRASSKHPDVSSEKKTADTDTKPQQHN